jgi:hypothetical protein
MIMWTIQENSLLGQPIGDTSLIQRHALGTIVRAKDPTYGAGEFIYLKGVAGTVIGSVAVYNLDDGSTTLVAAGGVGALAVAMSANVASQYGWYQIQGKAVVKAGTVVDNAAVYATAVGGQVDDAVVAGDLITNALFASADGTPSAGLAECEIARPFIT